jgi:hypothetical protein
VATIAEGPNALSLFRAPLREFVEDIWLYADYAGAHRRERIFPSGTFKIVFNLREDELRIYGPANPGRVFAASVEL